MKLKYIFFYFLPFTSTNFNLKKHPTDDINLDSVIINATPFFFDYVINSFVGNKLKLSITKFCIFYEKKKQQLYFVLLCYECEKKNLNV